MKKSKGLKIVACALAVSVSMGLFSACSFDLKGTITEIYNECLETLGFKEKEETPKETLFNVIYQTNGGSAVEKDVFKKDEIPAKPTAPRKEGYVFEGWYLDEDCTRGYDFDYAPNADITLYALFTEKPYTVKFVTDNGQNIEDEVCEKGALPQRPTNPEKEGFTFGGWYLEDTFATKYEFDYPLNEDKTLYAKFTEILYTVSYSTNGGAEVEETVCKWGVAPTKPENPANGDLTFIGWYLDEELTSAYDFTTPLNADTTLYARFSDAIPVTTAEELAAISKNTAGKYILLNDINMHGAVWSPISSFSGEIDGNGYKIFNFVMGVIVDSINSAGLVMENRGTIKNLNVSNFNVSVSSTGGDYYAGIIAAKNGGTIENCSVSEGVMSYRVTINYYDVYDCKYAGIIAGENQATGKIINCKTNGINFKGYAEFGQTGGDYLWYVAGGAVGLNKGSIEDTVITAVVDITLNSVRGDSYTIAHVGGLVGHNYGAIKESGANVTMAVNSTENGGREEVYLGGCVSIGYENGTIENCYAKGAIVDKTGGFNVVRIGGFINENVQEIKNSYADIAIAAVSAETSEIGGFVATNKKSIISCYVSANIVTSAVGNVGGFVAHNDSIGAISGCLSSVSITATHENINRFMMTNATGSILFNCYENSETKIIVNDNESFEIATATGVHSISEAELLSEKILVDTLYWDTEIWNIDGVNLPALAWEKV